MYICMRVRMSYFGSTHICARGFRGALGLGDSIGCLGWGILGLPILIGFSKKSWSKKGFSVVQWAKRPHHCSGELGSG